MATARFYVVVRGDLSPGQQAVQAVHAATEYAESVGGVKDLALALLAGPSEAFLDDLVELAKYHAVPFAAFTEEDLGHALTAVAFHPSMARHLKKLPLALCP